MQKNNDLTFKRILLIEKIDAKTKGILKLKIALDLTFKNLFNI
jgi:hypothetical protein